MAKKQGSFRIGTSNIVVPGNKTTFPPEYQGRSRLYYYASLFNSLEVNSSFYKVPMARTFTRWASEVNDNFQFTVKLFKGVTHNKGLVFDAGHVISFLDVTSALGPTRGPLLIQFPKSINFERWNQLEELLNVIADHDPVCRVAVEFRHPSWYVGETFELLDQLGAALVMHDMPGAIPSSGKKRAFFSYYRFHGEKGDYRGSYSDDRLGAVADEMEKLLKAGKDVYAYFNNTIGDAFANARSLQAMMSVKGFG